MENMQGKKFYQRWWFRLITGLVIVATILIIFLITNSGDKEDSYVNNNVETTSNTKTTSKGKTKTKEKTKNKKEDDEEAKDKTKNKEEDDQKAKEETNSKSKFKESNVTYEDFLSIKIGDTYDKVVSLIGEGEYSSSIGLEENKSDTYTWRSSTGGSFSLTFESKVVTEKIQIGMKKGYYDVNMEKYNKIKKGMTYDQVKEILGDGELFIEMKIMSSITQTYTWKNEKGAFITCMSSDGKMISKAQKELEN